MEGSTISYERPEARRGRVLTGGSCVCIEITEPKRGSKTTVYLAFSTLVIYDE